MTCIHIFIYGFELIPWKTNCEFMDLPPILPSRYLQHIPAKRLTIRYYTENGRKITSKQFCVDYHQKRAFYWALATPAPRKLHTFRQNAPRR